MGERADGDEDGVRTAEPQPWEVAAIQEAVVTDEGSVSIYLNLIRHLSSYEAEEETGIGNGTIQRLRNGSWRRLYESTQTAILKYILSDDRYTASALGRYLDRIDTGSVSAARAVGEWVAVTLVQDVGEVTGRVPRLAAEEIAWLRERFAVPPTAEEDAGRAVRTRPARVLLATMNTIGAVPPEAIGIDPETADSGTLSRVTERMRERGRWDDAFRQQIAYLEFRIANYAQLMQDTAVKLMMLTRDDFPMTADSVEEMAAQLLEPENYKMPTGDERQAHIDRQVRALIGLSRKPPPDKGAIVGVMPNPAEGQSKEDRQVSTAPLDKFERVSHPSERKAKERQGKKKRA
jgi:hypothetical protein